MAEKYISPEQQAKEENAPPPHGLIGNDLVNHIKGLKDKYQIPGEDRPSPQYILAKIFWIVLIGWWVVSFFIQMNRASGYFLEGNVGFVLMLIERIGYGTLGVAILVWWWKKYASHGRSWGWWIGAACLIAALFLAMHNPIRDFPYLSSPQTVTLQNWETEWDDSGEYSTFFKLKGKSADGQKINFYINKFSYNQLPETDNDTKLAVEYLPYTKTVMSIKVQNKGYSTASDTGI